MAKITITLELTSLAQVEALEIALETHIDMETDRSKDKESGWDARRDAARLGGAQQVLKALRGGK